MEEEALTVDVDDDAVGTKTSRLSRLEESSKTAHLEKRYNKRCALKKEYYSVRVGNKAWHIINDSNCVRSIPKKEVNTSLELFF